MSEPVAPLGRRAELRRQRRRRRVRLVGLCLGLLALVAAGFAVYLGARDMPEPEPTAGPTERMQTTLSLQVQGPNGAGVANALLAHDPATNSGAVLLVPPQVLVSVPGAGSVPYGRAILSVTPQASRGALSDLLGVTIDDGWVLNLPSLVALVDGLGGIPVEVDVPVVQGSTVVLSPGEQTLDGVAAGVFLSYLAPGELEQVRLARIQEVLDGIINVLPRTEAELSALLTSLGPRSASSLPTDELSSFLLGLAVDDEAGALQYDTLPVINQDPGGGVVSFRLDEQRSQAVVDRLFADSVPEGARAEGNRFLVLNGVGTPGLGEAVRSKLVPEGLAFVSARNAPEFGVAKTQVLVPDTSAASRELGERVAQALGVPAASVATQEFGSIADVVVLVGADFTP